MRVDTSSTIPRLTIEIGQPGDESAHREDQGSRQCQHPAVGREHQAPILEGRLRYRLPCHALDTAPYDALLLVSFGGPEKPDDVLPFLENVTRGRGIPRERLDEVGEHYYAFGGRSPINDQNRDVHLRGGGGLRRRTGIDLPVYWGNRNWDPYLADTLRG